MDDNTLFGRILIAWAVVMVCALIVYAGERQATRDAACTEEAARADPA